VAIKRGCRSRLFFASICRRRKAHREMSLVVLYLPHGKTTAWSRLLYGSTAPRATLGILDHHPRTDQLLFWGIHLNSFKTDLIHIILS